MEVSKSTTRFSVRASKSKFIGGLVLVACSIVFSVCGIFEVFPHARVDNALLALFAAFLSVGSLALSLFLGTQMKALYPNDDQTHVLVRLSSYAAFLLAVCFLIFELEIVERPKNEMVGIAIMSAIALVVAFARMVGSKLGSYMAS